MKWQHVPKRNLNTGAVRAEQAIIKVEEGVKGAGQTVQHLRTQIALRAKRTWRFGVGGVGVVAIIIASWALPPGSGVVPWWGLALMGVGIFTALLGLCGPAALDTTDIRFFDPCDCLKCRGGLR